MKPMLHALLILLAVTAASPVKAQSQGIAPSPPAVTIEPDGLAPARLAAIQAALRGQKLDGWLFFDNPLSDPIAYRMLGVDPMRGVRTRRWYCLVPASGQPIKLLHAIESHALDGVPGSTILYHDWRALNRELAGLLHGLKRVAMQYSPRGELPSIGIVDGGTLDLVRSLGPEVVSSADLVAQLGSMLSPEELQSQASAAELLCSDEEAVAQEAVRRIRIGHPATERELQDFAMRRWEKEGLQADGDRPLVYVDANAADVHYAAPPTGSKVAGRNSVLLLDFSARAGKGPHAIYGDVAKIYYLGDEVPDEVARVARVVFQARDAAITFIRSRVEAGLPVTGAEVDDVARQVVKAFGYGDQFIHRTGHSIDTWCHGVGVNNDNLETHDAREHRVNTCFSIEPGIYLPGRFGIRSEVDVCLLPGDKPGTLRVEVRGGLQTEVKALLTEPPPHSTP